MTIQEKVYCMSVLESLRKAGLITSTEMTKCIDDIVADTSADKTVTPAA